MEMEKNRGRFGLAMPDALALPVIQGIEREGGTIRVTASDNVLVTKVQVRLLDGAGNLLEQGDAALPDPVYAPARWEYAASAWDLARNETVGVL